MTKAELIAAISEKTDYTKTVVNEILTAFNEAVIDGLKKGETINLVQLGKLIPVDKAPRKGRSPKDGTPIDIAGFRTAKLKVGKELKDSLNQ